MSEAGEAGEAAARVSLLSRPAPQGTRAWSHGSELRRGRGEGMPDGALWGPRATRSAARETDWEEHKGGGEHGTWHGTCGDVLWPIRRDARI